MSNRDIFDEEFDRISQQQDPFDNWTNYEQPPVQQKSSQKPLRIVLIAVALVVCFVLGWVLAIVVEPSEDDDRKNILDEVFNQMDYNFYKEISDEEWAYAVEMAGSVLMQYAGDQYSFLMSPQTYYDYENNVSETFTAATNLNEMFGMAYTMETNGMLVSEISVDSASYGKLQVGDLIVKMTDILEYQPIYDNLGVWTYDENGYLAVERNADGTPNTVKSQLFADGLVTAGYTSAQIGVYLQRVYSATFHVLRNGVISEIAIQRGPLGLSYDANNVNVNKRYDFEFVEYYFSESVNNISTPTFKNQSSTLDTYTERSLSSLPEKTGYVHINAFDDYNGTNCYTEFVAVMNLFKQNNLEYLVLDLKGNPGGYVHLTVNIAGLLISDRYLVADDAKKLTNSNGELLVTKLVDRNNRQSNYSIASTYANYFPQEELTSANNQSIKRIIVWTDGGSASASELLTGTLLDYQTAVHMGTKTYGKGIAQTITELDFTGVVQNIYGGTETYPWAVYYTFAEYYPPIGENIHGKGYTPQSNFIASDYQTLWTKANAYWSLVA